MMKGNRPNYEVMQTSRDVFLCVDVRFQGLMDVFNVLVNVFFYVLM